MWTIWENGFNESVADEWMTDRQKMMSLLQEERSWKRLLKMVGMDALSPSDRPEDGSGPFHP